MKSLRCSRAVNKKRPPSIVDPVLYAFALERAHYGTLEAAIERGRCSLERSLRWLHQVAIGLLEVEGLGFSCHGDVRLDACDESDAARSSRRIC